MLSIQPDRLKTLRKSRGFGRTRLAKLSGVSERQIARLEGVLPAKGVMTEDLLLRLASALQTHPEPRF